MLTAVDGIHEGLVRDVRAQIERGDYLTEEKLNGAIHRLLCELMTEEEERVL